MTCSLRTIVLAVVVLIGGAGPDSLWAGDAAVQLTFDGSATKAAWSPDGARIAHMSTRGPSGAWNLWTIPADGGVPTQLTVSPPQLSWPAFSPSGDRIACNSIVSSPNYIWVVPGQGGTATQITSGGLDSQPTWSPDGRIAFSSHRDGRTSIWVVSADGGVPVQLTSGPRAAETCPAWSPDGTRIAFVSLRGGLGGGIAVAPAAGGAVVLLTDSPTSNSDTSPSWSPDGSRIVFTRYSPGTWEDLWTVSADGGTPTQLTDGAGTRDTLPAWSPDGKRIVFTSDRSGAQELWSLPFGPVSIRSESWGAVKGKYRPQVSGAR